MPEEHRGGNAGVHRCGRQQIGLAEFDFEQRIKAYPNKGASGSNFAEFDQQIAIMPVSIDQALEGVTMKWNVGSTCQSCVTSNVKWTDGQNNNAGSTACWDVDGSSPPYADRWGRVTTHWNGTGKETIGLGWSVTASSTAVATANFETSGIDEVKELAPRCDDWLASPAPGCVLQADLDAGHQPVPGRWEGTTGTCSR